MIDPNRAILISRIVMAAYAALLGIGGAMGFVKARSRISLIAGLASAAAILGALALSFWRPAVGNVVAFCLVVAIFCMFAARYRKTKKFVPAGLMLLVSLIVAMTLWWLGR